MPESAGSHSRSSDVDGESKKERIDRELIEFLNELRVAITGVQLLFAFLLTVPFAQGFRRVTDFQRDAYFVTLAAAAVASVFLIAPAAQHRILFRSKDKEQLLRRANRYAAVGMAAVAVAICSALMLVVDYIFGRSRAYVVAVLLAAIIVWWWLVLPMVARWRHARAGELHEG